MLGRELQKYLKSDFFHDFSVEDDFQLEKFFMTCKNLVLELLKHFWSF
jgi:hypothetical protein